MTDRVKLTFKQARSGSEIHISISEIKMYYIKNSGRRVEIDMIDSLPVPREDCNVTMRSVSSATDGNYSTAWRSLNCCTFTGKENAKHGDLF